MRWDRMKFGAVVTLKGAASLFHFRMILPTVLGLESYVKQR
jgi:hypothetical protein